MSYSNQIRDLRILKILIENLQSTSSSNEKKEILINTIRKHPNIEKFLWSAHNPFIQYHLTHETALEQGMAGDLNSNIPEYNITNSRYDISNIFKILKDLSDRKITGNCACSIWKTYILNLPDNLQKIAGYILDKDFKCRIGTKIINKVFEQLNLSPIPEFNIALGQSWNGEDVWNESRNWYASRKLDGVRCIAILRQGKAPELLSRQGKPFNTTKKLSRALRAYDGVSCVLDGELALSTPDGKDNFQGLMKQIRRKDHQIRNIVYYVFDWIPFKNFQIGHNPGFLFRQTVLKHVIRIFNRSIIRVVKQIKITNEDKLRSMMERSDKKGWEGLILRKDALYQGKRSRDILKVKKMQEMEATIIDVEMGTMNIVEEGEEKTIKILSAAIIEYKKNRVRVGSGWNLEQRKYYYNNPKELIGKIITVQYFEKTQNKMGQWSLRFPVIKIVHGEKRET